MTTATSVPATSCLLLLLFGCATSTPLYLQEGDACLDGGTCRRVRHCPAAVEAIQKRQPTPRRCGFVGRDEIVCCSERTSGVEGREVDATDLAADGKNRGADGSSNDIAADDGVSAALSDRPSAAACGDYTKKRNGLDDYILNGKIAGDEEFPHMAALGYNVPNTEGVSWLCGGTLISDQFVLTAAHCCASRITGQPVNVRLGTLAPTSEAAGGSEYSISSITMHPSYRKRQHFHDVALLKLDRKVAFSETVFPACLDAKAADSADFLATGWGATNAAGTRASLVLMKTTISPFPLSNCESTFKDKFPGGLNSSVICAGDPQGKTDTCLGDSGGPLVTGNKAPYSVVGITSLGPKPCGGTVPSIYTRVSSYVGWLEENVWP